MPTPVSSLLHAATLVVAGIYLLVRSSPILEYSPTALCVITWVGAVTSIFAAASGLLQNDLKRIIAFSTVSQLGYDKLQNTVFYFCLLLLLSLALNQRIYVSLYSETVSFFLLNSQILFVTRRTHFSVRSPVQKNFISSDHKPRDNSTIKYLDIFNSINAQNRVIVKQKYNKVAGIYMWLNNINGRCYIGSSINLYSRMNNYLSPYYISRTKEKMAICSSINKYGIEQFSFAILEKIELDNTVELKDMLVKQENYWFNIVKPSYNIQSILNPFAGSNHYRYGKQVSQEVKDKISKSLTGRIRAPKTIENHVQGAIKKPVYCYDSSTDKLFKEFKGLRIAARELGLNSAHIIRRRLDKNQPLTVIFKGNTIDLIFKSQKE